MMSFPKFRKTLMFLQFLKKERGTVKQTTDVSTDICQNFLVKYYPSNSECGFRKGFSSQH